MELRQLKTFEAICRLGSFSAAAEELGYAQSSVTAQIKLLEEEARAPLFERMRRGVCPTVKGAALLGHAQKILLEEERALADLSDEEPAGLLRIGVFESLGAALLPGVLVRMRRQWPAVTLSVTSGSQPALEESARGNQLDVLWVFGDQPPEPDFICLATLPHALVLICSPEEELAGQQVTLSELADQNLILGENTCRYRRRIQQTMRENGLRPQVFMEIENTELTRQLAAAGLGSALLPRFLVQDLLDLGRLGQAEVAGLDTVMHARVLVHKNKWVSPAIQAFVRAVTEDEKVQRFTLK